MTSLEAALLWVGDLAALVVFLELARGLVRTRGILR